MHLRLRNRWPLLGRDLLMYLGRVGPVSFALSLVAGSSSRKEIMPEGKIVVG